MTNTGGEQTVESREELQARVRHTLVRLSRSGELPSLPAVATAALAIARDPMADVDKLCRVIQTDVGIAARVLRVANSAIYSQRRPAKTLNQAVTTIGFRTMSDILMAASLRSLFDAKSPYAQRLWDHALAVALACEEVARTTGNVQVGTCFLPGLLHDIGRVVFLFTDPAPLDVIANLLADGEGQQSQLEVEWYGFDHAAASATLAEEWGVAAEACDAVRWHHEPASASAGRKMAEIINVADRLIYTIGLGTGPVPPPSATIPGLALAPEEEAACAARAREAFDTQRSLFQ
ncbi:MAG: HDOD domain-containing protein [Candidatus Binatia bacterium]